MSLAEPSADPLHLSVTRKGHVRITPRLRETYLTPDVDSCIVDASGNFVRIWIWSENRNLCISLPLDAPRFSRGFRRSIHRWGVNVNRWRTPGNTPDDRYDEPLWYEQGSLEVGYGGESGQELIEAFAEPFEGVKPDYV